MKEKTVGVIGGMGPEATVDLMRRVLRATPAKDDVDHIRMVVDNNPKVPSRMRAIVEGTGEDPAATMAEMARKLAEWGVDFLAIPCNTAHYYYDQVASAVNIPVLNMIELTAKTVIAESSGIRTVGLLASTAVLLTQLYDKRFQAKAVDVIHPSSKLQDRLMAAICKVKTGRYGQDVRDTLRSAANELVGRRAEVLIIACTELSVIADAVDVDVKLYDSSQVLAETIVRMAKG